MLSFVTNLFKRKEKTASERREIDLKITTNVQSQIIENEEEAETHIEGLNNDAFRDKYGEGADDYSYLTPEGAQALLYVLKASGKYLPKEQYFGLMDAIAAKDDKKWLEKIEGMTPKETLDWFNLNRIIKTRMSSTIWRAVGEKVAPCHEEELLSKLKKVSGSKVEGWIDTRKKEGFFFTQHVYDVAKSKRIASLQKKTKVEDESKTLENIKRNIRRNRMKMLEGGDATQYNFYLEKFKSITGYDYGTKND